MTQFKVYNLETAPEKSKPALQRLQSAVGMIPNLAGTMAESAPLIEGFEALRTIFHNKGTFELKEREVLSLTNAVENNCEYCVAIHSTFALKAGVSQNVVNAIRGGQTPDDPRFGTLAAFTKKLIHKRGLVTEKDVTEFMSAGFSKDQALEVVVGLATSILANYSRHITHAPLDEILRPQEWTPRK